MGNLHAGHIQLMRLRSIARRAHVVSIFVNRIQSGRRGFERYPRTLQADAEMMKDVAWTWCRADEREIYPEPQTSWWSLRTPAHPRGAFRPGTSAASPRSCSSSSTWSPRTPRFSARRTTTVRVGCRDMVKQLALPVEIIPAERCAPKTGSRSARERVSDARGSDRSRAAVPESCRKPRWPCSRGRDFSKLEGEALATFNGSGRRTTVANQEAVHLQLPSPSDRNPSSSGAAKLGKPELIDNVEVSL